MGIATLLKAELGRTMAGVPAREWADPNMVCVSPLSKSPLSLTPPLSSCPPYWGWDTEKIHCSFSSRTAGKKILLGRKLCKSPWETHQRSREQ